MMVAECCPVAVIRADGAAASYGLLDWMAEQNQIPCRGVEYSVGFAIADGGVYAGGGVAELTGLLVISR